MAVAIDWRWAVAALGFVCGPALAQQASLSSNPFNVSSPQITPGLAQTLFDVYTTTTYDSNVARSDAQLAAERGLKPQDVIFQPGGEVVLSRPIGRETIYLSGDVGYSAYLRNSILDRMRVQVAGGAIGRIAICSANIAGAFNRQQQDLADLALEAAGHTLTSVKNVIQDQLVSLTATCGRTIGIAPTFSISHTGITNSNPQLGVVDADQLAGSGGLAYQSPVLGVLSLTGQYSRVDYPNRFILTPSGLQSLDFRTLGGGVNYTRLVGSRLQGSAALSYTDLETDSPTSRGFKGFTYAFDFAYAVNPLLNAAVQIERATVPSNRPDASFIVSELYLAKLTYKLGSRTTLTGGVSRLHRDYEGQIVALDNDLTIQTINSLYASAGLALTRRLSFELMVQGQRTAANFPGLSYSDVQIGLTARASF